MRNHVQPLGYLRYGDDFILFVNDRERAVEAQRAATAWLNDHLKLYIHPNNNVIIKTRAGLHFLGHRIYPASPLSVDRSMLNRLHKSINTNNAASYYAMNLPRKEVKRITWLLAESETPKYWI